MCAGPSSSPAQLPVTRGGLLAESGEADSQTYSLRSVLEGTKGWALDIKHTCPPHPVHKVSSLSGTFSASSCLSALEEPPRLCLWVHPSF